MRPTFFKKRVHKYDLVTITSRDKKSWEAPIYLSISIHSYEN